MQIAPPSRGDIETYREIGHELEAEAGRINGRFAEVDWMPLRYLNRRLRAHCADAASIAEAQVGLVTPLRDGMNLVAKEYVAAQDPDDPGVLVLSQFAGAARELDAALIVNPYDEAGVAAALDRALAMGSMSGASGMRRCSPASLEVRHQAVGKNCMTTLVDGGTGRSLREIYTRLAQAIDWRRRNAPRWEASKDSKRTEGDHAVPEPVPPEIHALGRPGRLAAFYSSIIRTASAIAAPRIACWSGA